MLLAVENLRVSYGRIKALHGISFQLDEGEIVCIIGANGAGKSTTLRAISRMIPVPQIRWSASSAFHMFLREDVSSRT